MSKIIVDSLETNIGGPFQIDGDLSVTGSVNVSGADGITANAFYGNGAGLTNLPQNTFTGNTSGTCIQDLWLEYLMGCNGSLNVVGDVNVSGYLSASTLYGDGSYITQQINQIELTGNDADSTTTYLNYGINIVVSGDVSNFVARLPLVPIQGRTVTVINNCGISMVLYPSMSGGSINGVVNGVAIIPSDNKSYTFTCYENPAPGSWSGPNITAAGQYDSGEITVDTFNGPGFLGDVVSASDPARVVVSEGFYGNAGWAYDGLNQPYYFVNTTNSSPLFAYVAFKPAVPWNQITKVTIYTNITRPVSSVFGITEGSFYNYYIPGSTASADFITAGNAFGGNYGSPSYFYFGNTFLSGTPITTGTTTGSTSGFTAHAGEPGTIWTECVYNAGGGPMQIGDIFIQTNTFNFPLPVGTITADQWLTRYINLQWQPGYYGQGIKFRFIIDYI